MATNKESLQLRPSELRTSSERQPNAGWHRRRRSLHWRSRSY